MNERWIDGLDAAIRPPQEMAILCIKATLPIWRQNAGNRAEPVAHAYRRLLGRDMPLPILISAIHHQGRWQTVHTHPGGVLIVHDAARGGWEIRVIRPELNAALVKAYNAAERLKKGHEDSGGFALDRFKKRADGRIGSSGLAWVRNAAA